MYGVRMDSENERESVLYGSQLVKWVFVYVCMPPLYVCCPNLFCIVVVVVTLHVCSSLHRHPYFFVRDTFLWICSYASIWGANFSVCRLHLIRSQGLLRFNHRFFLTIFGLVFFLCFLYFLIIFYFIKKKTLYFFIFPHLFLFLCL